MSIYLEHFLSLQHFGAESYPSRNTKKGRFYFTEKLDLQYFLSYKQKILRKNIQSNLKPESLPNSNCIPDSFLSLTLKSRNEKQLDE